MVLVCAYFESIEEKDLEGHLFIIRTQNAMATAENSIESFVDTLMQQAGFDRLPEQYRTDYRTKLQLEVERRIGIIAMSALPKKDLSELSQKLASPRKMTSDQLQQFFAARIEGFPEKMAQGLKEFADEFLASVRKRSAAPSS
ncbi:MAG: hypothetical protein HY341_00175 [Candidatus Kerfeldbacteria bacterium]|nr:hypothetical protein [Candidatus Kerfeldbacteria bacterium]